MTTTKPEYEPLQLSARTIGSVSLALKVMEGHEPFNTICLLGQVLVRIHNTRCVLAARTDDMPDTVFTTSSLTVTHPGRRNELGELIPNNFILGVEKLSKDVTPSPIPNTTETGELLAELWDYCEDAIKIGAQLDARIRDQVPTVASHDHYRVVTAGADKVSGFSLVYLPTRDFTL